MTSSFIVQTDEHADPTTGDLIETGHFEVREVFANGDSEAVTCCVNEYEAITEARRLNHQYSPEGIQEHADEVQAFADQSKPAAWKAYAGNLTTAQHEARRRFAAVDIALGGNDLDIHAPENAHIVELLERWATAWAEAAK